MEPMTSRPAWAVIGGGQMARALVGGMLAREVVRGEQVTVVDPQEAVRGWWHSHLPAVSTAPEAIDAIRDAAVVLLAVKPGVVPAVLDQNIGGLAGKLVVSIAAGIGLDDLTGRVGHERVIRVMPNTPALVGSGASGYCCGDGVTPADREAIEAMLGAIGLAVAVEEPQMDAVTGLSGSGPAYVYVAIEALADGGVAAGLPRPLALRLAAQTVLGAARMVLESERHPAELKDAVASPGGTTIAGLRSLEQNGFRKSLIEAVVAAADRSRQLGRA